MVLADGTVITDLGGLEKDNTGYDLASVVCGSEGTLAVVTAARLRLVPAPTATCVALVGVASLEEGVEVAREVQRRLGGLEAAEHMDEHALEAVCERFDLPSPLVPLPPVVVLIEVVGNRVEDLLAGLGEVVGASGLTAVATDAGRQEKLWRYRHAIPEALTARGMPVKVDVSVPLTSLDRVVRLVRARVKGLVPEALVVVFGHLLDGNLHVNVLGADQVPLVTEAVLEVVVECGGSISAEHGIGRFKQPYLGLRRGEAERRMFARLKQAFDPAGLLNPGVLADLGT